MASSALCKLYRRTFVPNIGLHDARCVLSRAANLRHQLCDKLTFFYIIISRDIDTLFDVQYTVDTCRA